MASILKFRNNTIRFANAGSPSTPEMMIVHIQISNFQIPRFQLETRRKIVLSITIKARFPLCALSFSIGFREWELCLNFKGLLFCQQRPAMGTPVADSPGRSWRMMGFSDNDGTRSGNWFRFFSLEFLLWLDKATLYQERRFFHPLLVRVFWWKWTENVVVAWKTFIPFCWRKWDVMTGTGVVAFHT